MTGAGRHVQLWHDQHGRILAWGSVNTNAPVSLVAEPLAAPGQAVLDAEVAEHLLPRLHETHYVDAGIVTARDSGA